MKTDHIFYRIFKDLPETFFHLWGKISENVNNYRFDSLELKQIAFRIDGVYLPDDFEQPIYIYCYYQKIQLNYEYYFKSRTRTIY